MNNLYTEPTKDDLVYFAQRVIAALDVHVRGWRNTTLRCPTYPDCAAEAIRQLARGRRPISEADRKRESRVIAHMVEWLGKQYSRTAGRVPDNGTAHGLRQHSIGSTYPVLVVGSIGKDGVTRWHIEFAGMQSMKTPSAGEAQLWAENIAKHYRVCGWDAAKARLAGAFFYGGRV